MPILIFCGILLALGLFMVWTFGLVWGKRDGKLRVDES